MSRRHTPLLKVPAAFKFTQVRAANGNVTLRWQAADRADKYTVYMGTSSGAITTPVNDCVGSAKSCELTGLDPDVTYYFSVDASNVAGVKKITAAAPALSVKTFDIASSSVGDGIINLTWGASGNSTTYDVLYGTSPGAYTNVASGVSSPYTLTGLSNGVRYYVRILAKNSFNGYLLSTSEDNGQPFGPPPAPTGLSLSASPGQMVFSWGSVVGATQYKVFKGTSSGSLSEVTPAQTGTSYTNSPTTDGVPYFYAVKAFNGFDSVLSAEYSAQSISPFNVDPIVTGPLAMQLTISWNPTVGANIYDVFYGTNPAALNLSAMNVTSPHILTGLTGGSVYHVRVQARNTVGVGTSLISTNTVSATPVAPVSAPVGLTAAATPGQIVLNWSPVTGASGYQVLRATSSGGTFTSIGTPVGATFTDSGRTNGTPYFYIVRSFNGMYSGNSAEVSATPIESFGITSLVTSSSSALTVTWPLGGGTVDGAANFDVLYRVGAGSYTTVSNVTSPYQINGLSPATNYGVVVRARNAQGTGTNILTAEATQKTKTAAPATLTALATPGKITLSWPTVSGADDYTLYRSLTSTGPYTANPAATGISSLSYEDTAVADGTSYFYVVTASNGSDSVYSPEASARSISAFSLASAEVMSSTSIKVTWPQVTGAATYNVRYRIGAGSFTTITNVTVTPPAPYEYTISGLAPNTAYNVSVVARNIVGGGAGTSEASPELARTTAPASPVITATVANTGTTLNWTAIAGASSYKVYRGTSAGNLSTELITNHVPLTYTDSPNDPGVTYYYGVKAFNGEDSAMSNELFGQAVDDFTITTAALSTTSIRVSWTPPLGAGTNFDVLYRSTGATTTVANRTGTSYDITGLASGTTYYISVRSKNTIGVGSNTLSPEVTQVTPIGPPTGFAAVASPGKIDLSWNDATQATSYKIFRSTTSNTYDYNSPLTTVNDPTLVWSDTDNIVDGTTYYYVIRSFNGADSASSAEISRRPIADFTIATSTVASSNIIVTWDNTTAGAASFDVQYKRSVDGTYTTLASQTSPKDITGLTPNTTYNIRVVAKNVVGGGAGTSHTSAVINRITPFAAPSGLSATSPESQQVSLSWTPQAGATYKVYRRLTAGAYDYNSPVATGLTSGSYLGTGLTNGTRYYYVVRADNGSESLDSAEVSVTPIGVSNLLSATAVSSTQIDLIWDAADGATSYSIEYGPAVGSSLFVINGETGTTKSITALDPNTRYYFRVVAKNAAASAVNRTSNERNAITATAAPTGLIATTTTGQIKLDWTASPGAASYRVFRSTTSNTFDYNSPIATGLTGVTHTDTSVVADGSTYYYVVRAFNGTESPSSAQVLGQPIANFTITTAALSTSSIRVSWTAPAGAGTNFDILYRSTGATTTISDRTGASYDITGLSSGTTYYISVKAKNAVGSGTSTTSTEATQVTPIGPPTTLLATATPGQISLSWDAAGGASSYKLFRATSSGGYDYNSPVATINHPTLTYNDSTGISNGTSYFYVVRAFNGADSVSSGEISRRPIASFTASATASTANSITVSWNGDAAVTGAASYDIQYRTGAAAFANFGAGDFTTSPQTITGLSTNTSYDIRIVAKNSIGGGAGTTLTTTPVSRSTAFAAPTGLAASSPESQHVSLSWTPVAGATYKVFRKTSGSYDYNSPIVSGHTSGSYLDTGLTNGTKYYYVIRASNGSDSTDSSEVSITPIGTSTLSTVAAVSSTQINLTWAAAAGAATYSIEYGPSAGSSLFTINGETGTSKSITALDPNTRYFFRVIAKNADVSPVNRSSLELNAITATSGVDNLIATTSTSQIALNWDDEADITNYRIYRATSAGGQNFTTPYATVTSSNYTDIAATADGTTYYYIVRAYNGTESPNSSEASGRPIANFTISTAALSTSSIRVSWTAPAGAGTDFDILYRSSGATTTIPDRTGSSYDITGLSPNTTYYISVKAKNNIGSGTSTTSTEATQITPIAPPSTISLSSPLANRVKLDWSTVTGATSYKIYRRESAGSYNYSSPLATVNAPALTYTDNNTVANGTTYFYVIRAFNGADSADSAEPSIQPIANFSLTLTVLTANSIQVSWGAVSGAGSATSYDLVWGANSGDYTLGTLNNVSSPQTISGLSAASTYYFKATAKNSIGSTSTSRDSAEAGATTSFGAPANLRASSSGTGAVRLDWNIVSGATYKVFRRTGAAAYAEIANGVTDIFYNDSIPNGTSYDYVVRAFNGSTDSADSNTASIKTISTFATLAGTTASATTANLTWTDVTGEDSYDVFVRKTGDAYGTATANVATGSSSYGITGLEAGTVYFAYVKAKNSTGVAPGVTANSNEVTFKTSPAAISDLAITATPGNALLSWTAPASATSYKIMRGTAAGGPYGTTVAPSHGSASYTDSTVSNGTTYYYVVYANNGSESAISNQDSIRPISAFGSTPTASTLSPTSIRVNWTAPANVGSDDTFDIYVATSSNGYSSTPTVSGLAFNDTQEDITGLAANTTYFIQVRAKNNIGTTTTVSSTEISQITPIGPPTISATSTAGTVVLSWGSVTGATNYKVYRGTTSGSYGTEVTGVACCGYTDSPATDGSTYYYIVKSFNGADSAASNEIIIRPIAAPAAPALAATATTLVVTYGTTVAGAANYDIEYRTGAGAFAALAGGPFTTSPQTISGLTAGTTYDVRIVARNTVGGINASRTGTSAAQKTAIGAPTVAASATPGNVTLTWNNVAGTTDYKIFRSTTSNTYNYTTPFATTNNSTFTHSAAATNGTTYYYVMRSNNGTDSVDSTPEVAIQPISAFTTFTAVGASGTTATLSWADVAGEDAYEIYVKTSTGSYGAAIAKAANSTSHTLTGLSADTSYVVYLKAKNSVGSWNTEVSSSEVPFATAPGTISDLAITSPIQNRAGLTWTAPATATTYRIMRGIVDGGPYVTQVAAAHNSNSYNDDSIANGTTYYYVVYANNGVESAVSNQDSIKSVADFTIASKSALSTTSIQVNWNAASGADSYDVYVSQSSGSYGAATIADISAGTTTATISGLTANTVYYMKIRAKNSIGGVVTSRFSNEVFQITPIGAPVISSTTSAQGAVTINWGTGVSGATSYKLYRGTSTLSYPTEVDTNIACCQYVDTPAVDGTTYYYALKSYNGSDSVFSGEVSVRPVASVAAPTTSATVDTIAVNWNTTVLGAASFDVQYRTGAAAFANAHTGVTSSPQNITGLSAGTSYDVRIVAKNNVGGVVATYTSTTTTQLTALGAPVISAAATPGNIAISWSNLTGANTYKVFRSTTSNTYDYNSPLTSVASTPASTAATNGTTYYYVVRSNNGTDSISSNEISIQPISTFTLSPLSVLSETSIKVDWTDASGETSYDIYYRTASGSFGAPINVAAGTTTYTLSSLTPSTTYHVYVKAKNAVGSFNTYVDSTERTALTPTGAPQNLLLSATPTPTIRVGLNWDAMSGVTYNVYRSPDNSTWSQIATAVGTAAYVDTTVVAGTVYYYAVTASNGSESAKSASKSVKPIASFSLTAATTASSTSVNLTYGTPSGADAFDVRYGLSSGSLLFTATAETDGTYTLTGLSAATLYYVSIRAKNLEGDDTAFDSNIMTFTTSTAAPVLTSVVATAGKATLNWTPAGGETNFNIYRKTTGGYSQVASGITGSTHEDSSAFVDGTTYTYMIRGYNGTESADSNTIAAASVANFTISSTSAPTTTTISVAWNTAGGAAGYVIEYGTTAGNYTNSTISYTTSPQTITGLTANTTYYIRVKATNGVGGGATTYSNAVSQVTPVAAPTNLAATGGTSKVDLSWTASSGASSYKIYRSTTSNTYGAALAGNVNGTTYSDTTAVNGTTYYYVVRAFNGADSAASGEVFKQPIGAVTISGITSNSSSSIQVAFNAPTGAASYDLIYGTVSGSLGTTVTGVTSPASISGLVAGQTYYVQILAKNAIGGGTTVTSTESSGAPNSPPVLSAIADQVMEADTVLNVDFTLTDANHILTCAGSMNKASTNTTVLPTANIVFSGTLPNCRATITSAAGQVGTSTVTLTATDGVSPVSRSFLLTVNPCTVASIVWTTQPSNIVAGNLFGTAPRVTLRRADNSLCTTNLAPVTLDVSDDTSLQGDAAITGVDSAVPVNGVATFSGARMQRAGVDFTLIATQDEASSLDSNTFDVTAAAANKLVWEQEPQTSPTSAVMIPNPIVRVADTYGNYVNLNNHGITLSLQDNTEGATLGGTTTRNTNASGASTFSNNTINRVGSYYIRATSGTYGSINSSFFDVIAITPQDHTATIEMLQGPIVHTATVNTNYRRGYLNFASTDFDGIVTYTWKFVATNTATSSRVVRFRRGSTTISSYTIPANTTVPTLFTGSAISNANISSTASTYQLRVEGSGGVTLYSSRLIVKQTDAGRTQTLIPLSSLDRSINAPYASTTATTLGIPSEQNFPSYYWDKAKFGRLNTLMLYGVVQSSSTSGSVCVALYNKDTNSIIGTEVCKTGTTEGAVSLNLLPSDMPVTANLEARVRSNNAAYSARIMKVALIVRLVNITNNINFQFATGARTGLIASTDFVQERPSSYTADYAGGLVSEYVECMATASVAGAASFTYKNHGTNTSGTTSPSTISASTMNYSNQSAYTSLIAGPIVTTTANNQFMSFTRTSGTFDISRCFYSTEVTY